MTAALAAPSFGGHWWEYQKGSSAYHGVEPILTLLPLKRVQSTSQDDALGSSDRDECPVHHLAKVVLRVGTCLSPNPKVQSHTDYSQPCFLVLLKISFFPASPVPR